jgi:hypothetical protein
MPKLRKITVATLRDALNLFPNSYIGDSGELVISQDVYDKIKPEALVALRYDRVKNEMFGKTYLVDSAADSDCYLIIGEYDTNPKRVFNKFRYMGKMEYVPKEICTIHNEWELQE